VGGFNSQDEDGLKSAELYNPVTKVSCSLPQFPESRYKHTLNGNLVCGGGGDDSTLTSCDTWSNGAWTRTHNLRDKREFHVSWSTPSGVYLLGGTFSNTTSEIVKEDGSVEEGFDLKYETRY